MKTQILFLVLAVALIGCETRSRSTLGRTGTSSTALRPALQSYYSTNNPYTQPTIPAYNQYYYDDNENEDKGFIDSTIDFFAGTDDDPDRRESIKQGLTTAAIVGGVAAAGYGLYRILRGSKEESQVAASIDQQHLAYLQSRQLAAAEQEDQHDRGQEYRDEADADTLRTQLTVQKLKNAVREKMAAEEGQASEEETAKKDQQIEEAATCLLNDHPEAANQLSDIAAQLEEKG